MEIAYGDQSATIVEVGGGIRSYSLRGLPLLDPYDADAMCTSGRGQVLAPWPNRIERGRYTFDDVEHQLPLTEVSHMNAIHGLVRWASWRVAEREADRVAMEHLLHPQPGYPFTLAFRVEYRLSAEGLSVRLTATNKGMARCPYGAGAHPYLKLGDGSVDSLLLRVPAHTVLHGNEQGIPVRAEGVKSTPFDYREPRPIGNTVLDHAFTDLERDSDGLTRVHLSQPEGGNGVTLGVDQSFHYLMLFTGDTLPDVNRRSLAVEPMTCAPNAFRSGESLLVLEPGESTTSRWGIEPVIGAASQSGSAG